MKTQAQINATKPAVFTPVQGGLLQRKCACGNHTVAGGECVECAKNKSGLQRKLSIGASNDPLELEADRVADQVMAVPSHSAVSAAPPRIQRYAGQAAEGSNTAPASVDRVLASSGRPLEPVLRQDMEQRFGHDFSQVRVHSGGAAEQSANDVNANAYTVGHNIVFGAERFAPGTHEGRRLIAHELTHVVQQTGSNGLRVGQGGEKRGLSPMTIQRQRRGSAAGCGVCVPDPTGRGVVAGGIAHKEIQAALILSNPNILAEDEVPVAEPDEKIPFKPKVDLSYVTHENGQVIIHIGEIKPLDDAGIQAGEARKQLQDYAQELRFTYDEVFNMHDAPPASPVPFVNPWNPLGCPPQLIHVQRTEPGIYQYFCEPPWSQLVKNPACRRCLPTDDNEERKRDKVRVPVPLSPPLTAPNPQTEGQPQAQPGTKPQSEPDKKPAWKPEVIPGGKGKEDDKQTGSDEQPDQIQLAARTGMDAVRYVLGLVIVAAIVAAAAGLKKLGGKAGGPIYAFFQFLAAAFVIVLWERQAKAGGEKVDDDPLVALAQMFDDTGQKMPPEIREMIEKDPVLRELLRIEIEKRRRSGAKPSSGGTPGGPSNVPRTTATGSQKVPSSPIPSSGSVAGTPSDKSSQESKPATGGVQASPPSSATDSTKTKETPLGESSGKSYWESAKVALDRLENSSVENNKAKIENNLAVIPEGQLGVSWAFQRTGNAKAVWLIQFKVIKQTNTSTTIQIVWRGKMLLRVEGKKDDQQRPEPPAYAPGNIIVSGDPEK